MNLGHDLQKETVELVSHGKVASKVKLMSCRQTHQAYILPDGETESMHTLVIILIYGYKWSSEWSRRGDTSHQLAHTGGVTVPWESRTGREAHVLADSSITSVGKMESRGPRVSSAIVVVASS